MRPRPRLSAIVPALAVAVALCSGCVVASPDDDTFGDAAVSTLGTAASEVGTIGSMLDLLDDDRITRPVVVSQLRHSEASLDQAAAGFEALNPPPGTDALAQEAGDLLDRSADALQDARQAVRRRQISDYAVIARDLRAVADDLQALQRSVP